MPTYTLNRLNTVQLPDFQKWTDKFGMVQDNDQGNTTGNGNLYTAHYIAGLWITNQMNSTERNRLAEVFRNNLLQPGLLLRSPENHDYQQHDDYFGMLSADAILNPDTRSFAKQMQAYANVGAWRVDDQDTSAASKYNNWLYAILKPFGCKNTFNTHNPGSFAGRSWLGRRIDLMATMKMSLKKPMNPLIWIYWAILMCQFLRKKNDNQDANMMAWHSAIACNGYGIITNIICRGVRKALIKNWGGAGQLLSQYFGKPQHPLVALLKDKA